MAKVTIETNGEPTTVVVDGKSADFGPSAPPAGGNAPTAPNGDPAAPAITTKPYVVGSLGAGGGRVEPMMMANQVIGLDFVTRTGATTREISWSGMPGGWWNRCSWAVFDSGGGRVMGEDNVLPGGTLGYAIDPTKLVALGAGNYTLALVVNGPGNNVPGKMGVHYNQA